MKILFLIDNLGSGGAQRQVATIAPLLKERGNEVIVATYFRMDFFAEQLKKHKVPIICIERSNYITRTLAIRKYIRRGGFDAVISFLENPDFINCFAAIGGKKWTVVASERSAKEETFFTKQHKFTAWIKRFSDYIVCNSENAHQLWIKYYPQYESKLKVIYNAVTVAPTSTKYIPRRDGKIHFVVSASFQYLKNPVNVIKAIDQLGEMKQQIILDWYGNSKGANKACYAECCELIDMLKLHDCIKLHEPTDIIHEKMQQADCVCLFSRLEGLPNAICEAMTLGKPIIMSKVSDYNRLIDDSNGVLCDWDDIKSIAEAFRKIINKSERELCEMGFHSHSKSTRLFSPSIVGDSWINLIK